MSNGMVQASNILNVPRKPSPNMFEIVRTDGDYCTNVEKLPLFCIEHWLQLASAGVVDNTVLPSSESLVLVPSYSSVPQETSSDDQISQLVEMLDYQHYPLVRFQYVADYTCAYAAK